MAHAIGQRRARNEFYAAASGIERLELQIFARDIAFAENIGESAVSLAEYRRTVDRRAQMHYRAFAVVEHVEEHFPLSEPFGFGIWGTGGWGEPRGGV